MADELALRHLRAGWWGLALFVVLGAILELFHAIKSPLFVDAGQETTRLLLRLAHAHGTLLALVNIGYALTVRAYPEAARRSSSALLLGALVLLPGGFLAARADPGLGIVLVPAGAAFLFAGAALVGRALGRGG